MSAYESLSADDLPVDEPFDWTSVAVEDRDVVSSVLAALDAFTGDAMFARRQEYVTILRRLLAVAAQQPAGTIRRRTSPERIAAALAWIALRGHGELGRARGRLTADVLWWKFGVGDCAALARSMAESMGMLEEQPHAPARARWLVHVNDPNLMCGYRRRDEIDLRDHFIERVEAEEARRAANAVVQITEHGVQLLAHDTELVMCVPGFSDDGVPRIAIALGRDPVDPDEAFALGLEDAERLFASLQMALETHHRRSS